MSNTKSPASGAGDDDVGPTSPPTSLSAATRALILGTAAFAVLIVDQITKVWAVAELSDRNIDLFWTLRLNLTRNTGASFGLGSGGGRWLALVVLVVVAAVLRYARTIDDRRVVLLLGAIVGGAVGNLIDRVVRADDGWFSGGVIDFIDFQWWPIFNVADMAVVCGAIGLLLLSMREPT